MRDPQDVINDLNDIIGSLEDDKHNLQLIISDQADKIDMLVDADKENGRIVDNLERRIEELENTLYNIDRLLREQL